MADLSKIRLNGVNYNLKDAEARAAIAAIGEGAIADIPIATHSSNGLMSSTDKQILDNLNPNISVTISNLNTEEIHVINAKQENMVNLEITESPHISERIRTNNLLDVDNFTPGYYIGSNGALATNANDKVGDFIPVSPGDNIYYTGIIGPTNSSSINRRLHVYDANKTWIKQLNFAGSLRVGQAWSTNGTVPSNGAYIRVSWGVEDTNVMISIGAPAKYQPYYITPFEPISSASFQVASNEEYTDAVEYTITIPANAEDLYGFKYNPILGKLYATTGHITSYNGEILPNTEWHSDRDTYEEGTTPSIGAEVIYILDNEDIVEYNFTPLTVPLFYHVNYIKIDNGIINSITYYAETIAVSHLTIQNGITFGETEFIEDDIIEWKHAGELIDTKAPIESPTFTGGPTAPTPGASSNSTRIATTEFVQGRLNNIAPVEANINKASKSYEVGEYLIVSGQLYKVTAAIVQNTAMTAGTNISATDMATELNLLRSLIS